MVKSGVIVALLCVSISARAQEPHSPSSGRGSVLDVGLGVCAPVIYDESFSLVRQNGLGPALFLRYSRSTETSTHVVESNSCVSKFHSDVFDRSYELSGAHTQERLAYKYFRHYTIGGLVLSSGPSVVFDLSKTVPEGLVINNAPLHDFNLQLQVAARATYQIEVMKRQVRISYDMDLPVYGYNSRPDYLGFTEFSGRSKYFNKAARWSFVDSDYFYLKHSVQLEMSPAKKNHFSIYFGQYFSQNKLSKPYRNLSNAVVAAYSRKF